MNKMFYKENCTSTVEPLKVVCVLWNYVGSVKNARGERFLHPKESTVD